MSNIGSLIQNGGVTLGEAIPQFESMTEADMSALAYIALQEGMMEGVTEVMGDESSGTVMEGTLPDDLPVLEVSIVRLDKKAKKQQAYKLAILQCARDDDNKDYKKLETIWRMEKFIFRKLEKRYSARAKSRMKQTAKKTTGNHPIVSKARQILNRGGETRSQKETKKALAGQTKPPADVKKQFGAITQKLGAKLNREATPSAVR